MAEQTALIAALAAEPDSQIKRLMYADWLEEHGDAWASIFRSGGFCRAMGWQPNETIWARQWENAAEYTSEATYALPDAVFAWLPAHFHTGSGIESTAQESYDAASLAFIQAWCTGWCPLQTDCRGEVRLPGGPAFQLVATREETRHTLTWPLIFNQSVQVGRGPNNNFSVSWDRFISRSHFTILLNSYQLQIEIHTNTRHPAIFKGQQSRQFQLSPGESFTVGETTFRFEEADEHRIYFTDRTEP